MNEQVPQTQPPPRQPVSAAQPPVQYVQAPPPQPAPRPAAPPPVPVEPEKEARARQEVVYGHSTLFYWWPVWAVGYGMAALTWWRGGPHEVGGQQVWLHPSGNLGVIFCLVVFLVVLVTSVSVRGMASALAISLLVLATVVLAYFDLWGPILGWLGDLNVYLNFGAYFWFSTLLFLTWALFFLVIDRLSYWRFKPGQVTHEFVFGAGSKSYDTNGMTLEKHRGDLFRHWLLGMGAGDLEIHTSGAQKDRIPVPNVLFIGTKIERLQRLVAEEPGDEAL